MISSSWDWYKQKSQSDHLIAVIINICRLLRIPVTITGIRLAVKGHPDYPSLLSIAQTLERFNFKTEALKGSVNDLTEVDCPSIVHLKNNQFAIIEELNEQEVRLLNPVKGPEYHSFEQFEKIWSGVLLRVSPNQNAGEKDYQNKKKKERISTLRKFLILPGLILFATILYGFGLTGVRNTGTLLSLWGVKLMGLMICFTMFNESPVMQYFCGLGKRINCVKVLRSPAGKVFGISMAELGLIYFSGGLLTLLFAPYIGYEGGSVFTLAVLNVLTLPYTLFSIFYQAFVINTWCILCLSVQMLFWVEFFLLFPLLSNGATGFYWALLAPIFTLFAISILIWIGLRSLLIRSKRAIYLEQKLFWSDIKIKPNKH